MIGGRSLTAAACLLLTCCGAPPTPPPPPGAALLHVPPSAIAQLEVRSLERRPPLTLLSREGDPAPVVGVSILTGNSRRSVAIAALLEHRLDRPGLDLFSRLDHGAAHLQWADGGGGDAALAALAASLPSAWTASVTAEEAAFVARRLSALDQLPPSSERVREIAACTGELYIEPDPIDVSTPEGREALDAWRQESLGTARTALSVVGPATTCRAVAEAIERQDGWPVGSPAPPSAWPEANTTTVYAAANAEMTVAVHLPNPSAAVFAAQQLADLPSPLSVRVADSGFPWEVGEVIGSARPEGGCVAIRVQSREEPPPVADVGRLANVLRAEIERQARINDDPTVATRAILETGQARHAAALAAWWALSKPLPAETPTRVSVALGYAAGPTPKHAPDESALRKALEQTLSSEPAALRRVDRAIRVERGQSHFSLLLANPCALAEEGSANAGGAALATMTGSLQSRAPHGIRIEPFVQAEGVGLIAHGLLEGDDDPSALARRVARALGQAIARRDLDHLALADMRSRSQTTLQDLTGPVGLTFEELLDRAAPGQPSALLPLTFRRATALSDAVVNERWQGLWRGQLKLAIVANADIAQAEAAIAALEPWLPAQSQAACDASGLATPTAGEAHVDIPSNSAAAQSLIGLVDDRGSSGRAELTTHWLNDRLGRFQRFARTLDGQVRIRELGSQERRVVVIEARTPADKVAETTEALTGFLDKLSQKGPNTASYQRAVAAMKLRHHDIAADPRQRLIDVYTETKSRNIPSLDEWLQWLSQAPRADHRIVIKALPR